MFGHYTTGPRGAAVAEYTSRAANGQVPVGEADPQPQRDRPRTRARTTASHP